MNNLNHPSYNLPPLRKIGPAVLPKPKNIKIQAGRATINFSSSDGSANRPTITITTNNTRNNPNNHNMNHFQVQQPIETGTSYNIPIQYTNSKQHTPMSRHVDLTPNPNPTTSTFNGYNNSNSTSYTIPVNLSLDTDNDPDKSKSMQSNRHNSTNNGGLRITEKPKSTTNSNLDEVDLLKDLLMKNLNASSDPNFFGMCLKCNEKIYGADNGLRAMDQLFHVECFACQGCSVGLQGKHFYAMDKKSFCENCYMKLLEKCTLCARSITDRILRATGKPFHPECFNCISCAHNLDGIPFTVDASNKIHCINCFHDKYAPRCFICHLSIVPDPGNEETVRIVAMDKSFHVHCYKCQDCGVSLSSNAENVGGCFPLDDHILCKACNINRIRNLVTSHDLQSDMHNNQKLLRSQMNMLNHQNHQNNNGSQANFNARSTDL